MVKHQIDDDARNGNIQPDRINEASEPAMIVETAFQGTVKRCNDERSDDGGEYRMRSEDGEVDRPCESLPRELRRPESEIIRSKSVMADV